MPQSAHNGAVPIATVPEQNRIASRTASAGASGTHAFSIDSPASYQSTAASSSLSSFGSTRSTPPHTATKKSHSPPPPSSSESEDGDDDKIPPLTRWQILCLCLPAAAVQVGWTVGESLLIPYLLSLGVSNTVANFAWLINPLFGLFLQPMLGHASDNCHSSFGRRRPFLFVFHLGSVCGLLTVVFAAELLQAIGLPPQTEDGRPSVYLITLIFAGFATADMCHDLLLMPARALLNDQLPDAQTDEGNAYFALISSLGSIIGLSMVIAPLDELPLLRRLQLPIRATFFCAAALVMLSNILSFIIAGKIDTPLDELNLKHNHDDEADAHQHSQLNHTADSHSSTSATSTLALPPPPSPHKSSSGEQFLTLSTILFVYRIVPRPLVVIWLCQFFFWYAVLHVNIWTSSYVAVDIYGAGVGDEFDAGVRAATVGLLVQAVVSFVSSSVMTRANATFGITNYYHFSALLYGSAAVAMYFFRNYIVFLVLMAVTGVALPAIYSSPFVLIEVHAADVDDDDEDDEVAETEEEREEEERRKEHKQLDVHLDKALSHSADNTMPHSLSTIDATQSQPASAKAARPVKHVSISMPASASASPHHSPDASPHPIDSAGGVEEAAASEVEADSDETAYDMEFLDEWRGVLTGVYNVTMTLAQIIVGLTSGAMIDWYGHIGIVFVWSGALCVVVHGCVAALGLSKPKEEAEVEEEDEEEETPLAATETTPLMPTRPKLFLQPSRLARQQSIVPAMPPLIDYRQFSTRALPGRLKSYVNLPHMHPPPGRHVRHLTHHHASSFDSADLLPPSLHRSLSAPALVLLSRPKRVVRGVPVFQSHATVSGRAASNERMKLERLRERTRLFNNQTSPAVRRRHNQLTGKSAQGSRPYHHVAYTERKQHEADTHERDMWFSGKQAHQQAAKRHDRALQEADRTEAALQQAGDELYDDEDGGSAPSSGPVTAQAALLPEGSEHGGRESVFNFDVHSARSIALQQQQQQQAAHESSEHRAGGSDEVARYPFPLRASLSLPDIHEERRQRHAVEERIAEEEEEELDSASSEDR